MRLADIEARIADGCPSTLDHHGRAFWQLGKASMMLLQAQDEIARLKARIDRLEAPTCGWCGQPDAEAEPCRCHD